MRSVKEIFTRLRDSKVVYTVIKDWDKLPHNHSTDIEILVADAPVFRQILGLTIVSGCRHVLLLDNGVAVHFLVYEKSDGVFPERFSSELLAHPVIKEDINVPEDRHAILISMYRLFCHDGIKLSSTDRAVWKRHIEDRIGIPVAPAKRTGIVLKK